MAFTDFGIETLTGLIEIHKADPELLRRSSNPEKRGCGLRRMLTNKLAEMAKNQRSAAERLLKCER